jgi:uncharacterized membrane protein
MEDFTIKNSDSHNIEINIIGINDLNETRKWTMFLSIVGFCFIGLAIVILVIAGILGSTLSPSRFALTSLIPLMLLVLIYFFPVYYLYQFSRYTKKATLEMKGEFAIKAFQYLKMHYRFMGILTIVILCLYLVLGLIFLLVGRHFGMP